jgi:hypothetical protein
VDGGGVQPVRGLGVAIVSCAWWRQFQYFVSVAN